MQQTEAHFNGQRLHPQQGFDVITDRQYDVVRNLGPLLKIDLARFQ